MYFNIHINLHFTPDHTHQLTSSDCPSLWLVAERFSTDFALWELNPRGPDFLSEKLPLNHFYQFVPGTRKNGAAGISPITHTHTHTHTKREMEKEIDRSIDRRERQREGERGGEREREGERGGEREREREIGPCQQARIHCGPRL